MPPRVEPRLRRGRPSPTRMHAAHAPLSFFSAVPDPTRTGTQGRRPLVWSGRPMASDLTPPASLAGLDVTRELLFAIADATSDLVHIKDLEGRYIMVNRATAELVGRPPADLVGLTPPEVFGPAVGDALVGNDRRVLDSGEPQLFDEEITIHGEVRSYSTSKAPVRDASGQVIGVVGISRDITDLRRLQEAVSAVPRPRGRGSLPNGPRRDARPGHDPTCRPRREGLDRRLRDRVHERGRHRRRRPQPRRAHRRLGARALPVDAPVRPASTRTSRR